MKVEIKNYRGVAEAALHMNPIALVAGLNGAGKSSIAQAVAAALTKNPAPVDGVTKGGAGVLLRDGAKRGRCTVGDETGSVTANWPGASTSEDGAVPRASEIAVGLQSVVAMKPKDAAAVLIYAMNASPTIEDLRAAIPGASDAKLQAIWQVIAAEGWDAALRRAKENGTKAWGAWEQIAGEKYDTVKGASWRHPALGSGELLPLADYEQAVADQAVSGGEVERLQALADAGTAAHATLAELNNTKADLQADLDTLRQQAAALPRPETPEALVACPHCAGHLVVVSRTEVRAPSATITAEENAARSQAIATAGQAVQAKQAELQVIDRQMAQAEYAVSDGEQARQRLADAERMLAAFRATTEAQAKHQAIAANGPVVEALSPDGVRQRVLTAKMAEFNATLARLSAAAGWPEVALSGDLQATLGGRAYLLLSESEKFRVRVVLQVALADLDGSDLVVVDAADILDRGGRNGLFKLLKTSGMRALVCMTMNAVGDVPNLAAAGLGQSYWLADSILAPLGA